MRKRRTKKNADQPRFFIRRKRTRLASRRDLGGSSRCHNRVAFLALTDVGVLLNEYSILQNMTETAMKQTRIIATIKRCRTPSWKYRYKSRFPRPSPIWKVASRYEPTLVSAQETATSRLEQRYKRRFTPPSPIWKVVARKVNLLWYRHGNRQLKMYRYARAMRIQEEIPVAQSYLESGNDER